METNKQARYSRFDDAEADVDRGEPWLFREPDAPNPLTIEATGWSKGHTRLGEAEFLNGTDRDGKKWSILIGGRIMQKRLIEGLVEEWDDKAGEFRVVETEDRVQPGEIVSIKYLGDREGAKYDYPDFRVSRRPPLQVESDIEADTSDFLPGAQKDEIPF
jgi:hypothetical protein